MSAKRETGARLLIYLLSLFELVWLALRAWLVEWPAAPAGGGQCGY
jgi:hypothetical protein